MSSEVPLTKRLIQVSCAIVACLLAAGPVFGFAALKPILIKEGVYSEKCQVNSFGDEQIFVRSSTPCVEQDLLLNFMFTIAAVFTNVAALPVGSLLDKYGPRFCGIVGSIFIFAAACLIRSGHAVTQSPILFWIDPYLVGYTLLSLGGPFVFISAFQLANSFPKNSGLILALLTGAFDSSLALFLVYRIVYFNIQKISISSFFTGYLFVPIFIFACQVLVMPKESYKSMGTLAKIGEMAIDETGRPLNPDLLYPEDRNRDREVPLFSDESRQNSSTFLNDNSDLMKRRESLVRRASVISRTLFALRLSVKSIYEVDAEVKLFNSSGGVFGIMHGFPIGEQLKLLWFILMALFTTIQMIRINYFVATIKSQELYLYHGNEEIAVQINEFFDLALPLCGILSIPFIGFALDNLTTLTILTSLLVISVFIGIMGVLSWLPATYLGIILLCLYRPFYYTAVSDFCAKVFGFETFGTVYGAIITFSGICNVLQLYIDGMTHDVFNMNPVPVNCMLTGLTVVFGSILLYFVKSQEMQLKRKNLELEAQEASVRGVPQ